MIKSVQDGNMKINSRLDHRVAILEKNGKFAAIALSECQFPTGVFVLGQTDKDGGLTHSPQLNGRDAALRNFGGSIRNSIEHGWRVAWSGFPFGPAVKGQSGPK